MNYLISNEVEKVKSKDKDCMLESNVFQLGSKRCFGFINWVDNVNCPP